MESLKIQYWGGIEKGISMEGFKEEIPEGFDQRRVDERENEDPIAEFDG